MRMSFGQEMRMAQKQMLAPRMIQSMEILQLPVMALEERIEQEIQNNETLEVDEPGLDEAAGGAAAADAASRSRGRRRRPRRSTSGP
jgi:RNA polymerase sigma-54 factor